MGGGRGLGERWLGEAAGSENLKGMSLVAVVVEGAKEVSAEACESSGSLESFEMYPGGTSSCVSNLPLSPLFFKGPCVGSLRSSLAAGAMARRISSSSSPSKSVSVLAGLCGSVGFSSEQDAPVIFTSPTNSVASSLGSSPCSFSTCSLLFVCSNSELAEPIAESFDIDEVAQDCFALIADSFLSCSTGEGLKVTRSDLCESYAAVYWSLGR